MELDVRVRETFSFAFEHHPSTGPKRLAVVSRFRGGLDARSEHPMRAGNGGPSRFPAVRSFERFDPQGAMETIPDFKKAKRHLFDK